MGRQSPATTAATTTTKVGKKKSKKRICKHFASGNCKFGDACRNIHEGGGTKNEVEPSSATNSQGGQVNTPPQPPSSTPNINTCLKSDLKELKDQALVTQKHLSEMNLMMAKLQMSYALANSTLEGMQSKISDMEDIIEDETPNEGRDVEEETHRVQQQVVSVREILPAVTPTSITSTKKSKAVPSPPAKPQSTKSTNKAKAAPVHQQSINPQTVKSSDDKPDNKEVEKDIKVSATNNTKTSTPPPPIKSTVIVSKPDKPQETAIKSREHLAAQQVDTSAAHTMHQPKDWPTLGDSSKVEDPPLPPSSPPPRDDNTRSMLEDIIINASGPYIGSPDKYISNLQKELEFSTAEEFVEIIKECLDVLALLKGGDASNEDLQFLYAVVGGVEKGKEDEFCRALLSAVSIITEVEAITTPLVEAPIVETPRVVADEMDAVKVSITNPHPIVKSTKSRAVKKSVVVELSGGSSLKSTNDKKAHVIPQEHVTKKVATDKKMAKPPRATRKEAKKAKEQSKQEALRKKKKAISAITLEQTAQEVVREEKLKSQYTSVSPTPTDEVIISPRHSASKVKSAKQRSAAQTSKPIVMPTNFSLYIKRERSKKNQDISPIFNLLQNETTRDKGRQLMRLEADTRACKQELSQLHKRKEGLRSEISQENTRIVKWNEELKQIEKEMQVKYALDNFLNMTKQDLGKVLFQMDEDDVEEGKGYRSMLANLATGGVSAVFGKNDGHPEISISIANNIDGSIHLLTVKTNMTVEQLFEMYSKKCGVDVEELKFSYLGDVLKPKMRIRMKVELDDGSTQIDDKEATLDMLKMDNGDFITVAFEDERSITEHNRDTRVSPKQWQHSIYSHVVDAETRRKMLRPTKDEIWELRVAKAAKSHKQHKAEMKEKEAKKAGEKFKDKRHKESKKAHAMVVRMKQQIEEAMQRIKDQNMPLFALDAPIREKKDELKGLRSMISSIKDGSHEDPNFHIDGTRDSRGHTFLMVATQNQDVITVELCFQLQADPMVTNSDGHTAVDYAHFFSFEGITELILQNGGIIPQKMSNAWTSLDSKSPLNEDSSKDWVDAQEVADAAALPAETLIESPQDCEEDENKRMHPLTEEEKGKDFTCFESRLIDQDINTNQVNRVVLLEQAAYSWLCTADATSTSNFITLIEGLKPVESRQPGVSSTSIRRRSIIGTTTTFEVLSASLFILDEGVMTEKVVLFSPYIGGEADGMTHIGVLVWGMVQDEEASLYKTLISNIEFMRNKIRLEDRFLEVKDPDAILKLGRDMHLLGLKSTSIYTTSTMDLFMLNIDEGHLDLQHIQSPHFSLKRRIVYSEEKINKAIFRGTETENHDNILSSEHRDMSTLIQGGAGTGKTLLLIKKIAKEEPSKKILVVSRLSRLVNKIKGDVEKTRAGAVENARDAGLDNLTFDTYDDFMQLLVGSVIPTSESESNSFIIFDRIRFDCEDGSGVSFKTKFNDGHLNSLERKKMTDNSIQPLVLWNAICTIKSNARCAITKCPLTLNEYLSLPLSFGLQTSQREICYNIFLKYEQWRNQETYWDETDRSTYVLKNGPSVLKEDVYLSWVERVKRGEMDLLNEGDPLDPFFFDLVACDEAQDFSELDLALFVRLSAGVRNVFFCADPAQSVEVGISMRKGTVNDVMNSLITDKRRQQVKENMQEIMLQTNHRTHQENLSLAKAIRSVLARSFRLQNSDEHSLIHGKIPQLLSIKKMSDLSNEDIFKGGNIVFLAPDEIVQDLRTQFHHLGIKNDLFSVREAKGLEFQQVALIGFWTFIESRGSSAQWQNCLRWLSSETKITVTQITGERIAGVVLNDCDYRLSAPQVSDEAMMLYTALTRARDQLYIIESDDCRKMTTKGGVGLAAFAFRRFVERNLAKEVPFIDEGFVEMTPSQHKARGILYMNTGLSMLRNHDPISLVKDKLLEAKKKFQPSRGNDMELLDKCEKHLDCIMTKWTIMQYAKTEFYEDKVGYMLEGKFTEVVKFEEMVSTFFSKFLCDSFMVEEVTEVRRLMEEIFMGTPYAVRFEDVCTSIERLECFV